MVMAFKTPVSLICDRSRFMVGLFWSFAFLFFSVGDWQLMKEKVISINAVTIALLEKKAFRLLPRAFLLLPEAGCYLNSILLSETNPISVFLIFLLLPGLFKLFEILEDQQYFFIMTDNFLFKLFKL